MPSFPIPLFGRGEDTASAPDAFPAGVVARLENAELGPGMVSQEPDWKELFAASDATGTPPGAGNENQAIVGLFPFSQPVGSDPGAFVGLSFDQSGNVIHLDHVGESGASLRRIAAYTGYALTNPPQVTGFEWFGKLIVCPYAREAASSRPGLGIYDPVAGTFTVPSLEIITGTAAAAPLRFRGISRHRTLVLGWGYKSEETGDIDRPDFLRWTAPAGVQANLANAAAWADGGIDDTSPGGAVIGTPGLPIIACAMSGLVSVIGKQDEVYSLEGEFGGALYVGRRLGDHGPVSTVGMVSYRDGAAWMADAGPVVSENGGAEQLLATNRLRRRLETYYDLSYTCAAHYRQATRVGWLLRRKRTITGEAKTTNWGDEILWWDYQRDEFIIRGLPTTCFSIGTSASSQVALVGPTGAPTVAAASNIAATSAQANWTNGDTTADVVTYVKYKRSADSIYVTLGAVGSGITSLLLTGLMASTGYDYKVVHYKNGQFSAESAVQSFTTGAASAVGTPSNFEAAAAGWYTDSKGIRYGNQEFTWTQGEYASGAVADLFEGTTNSFAAASVIFTLNASETAKSLSRVEGTVRYYWLRYRLVDGAVGSEAAVTPQPVTYTAEDL